MVDWTIIISSIGGSAALFGALAWLTRSIIVHYLDKDVERFKSSLELKAIEHQVRFNSLHAKRGEVIAEFYEKLAAFNTILNTFRDREKTSFSDQDKEMGLKVMTACADSLRFFKINELYFDEDLCAKVEKIGLRVFGEASLFAGMAHIWEQTKGKVEHRSPEIRQELERTLASTCSRLDSEIPALLSELKKRFREILGVPQGA